MESEILAVFIWLIWVVVRQRNILKNQKEIIKNQRAMLDNDIMLSENIRTIHERTP